MLAKLKNFFSIFFSKSNGNDFQLPQLGKKVLLISVTDPVRLNLYQENLRSNAVDFEVRDGTDIYVPEQELESAKVILQEGQWEY